MMKENINSFSFRRVGLLVKRDVGENWKVLSYSIGLGVGLFLYLMYSSLFYTNGGEHTRIVETDVLAAKLLVFANFYFFYVASMMMMRGMSMRKDRLNFLMIPAWNNEKFLSRSLYMVLHSWIVVIMSVVLADVFQMLLFPLIGYSQGGFGSFQQSLLPALCREIVSFNFFCHSQWGEWGSLFFVSMMLCAHSLFVLGGNYWRNNAYLKTLGVALLLIVGGAYLAFLIATNTPKELYHSIMWTHYSIYILVCSCFLFAWTILNWYWAYRLFCRSQVVEPKRFSL